jgi:hypothetical protein
MLNLQCSPNLYELVRSIVRFEDRGWYDAVHKATHKALGQTGLLVVDLER